MSKINIVAFQEGETSKTVHNGLWQWDYGQVLRIQGLSLPSAVEIHFSLQENGGEAKRRIGITESGVTDVVIPHFILEGNNPASGHYNAFAFIYPSDEESGETTHKIILRIRTRPRPEGDVSTDNEHDPDETTFGAIMAAVREIADKSGGNASDVTYDDTETKLGAENVQDAIGKLSGQIFPNDLKTALVNYYTHVMPNFDDTNGLSYVNAILTALGAETRGETGGEEEPDEPEITLTSISATYAGGEVTVGTALTDLTGITVKAHYSDGSTANVTDYTLSGTIAEGENTIIVTYNGLTTTFTVTGIAESGGEVVKTPFTGVNLLADYTIANNSTQPFGLVIDRDITLEAGTYYLYGIYKTATGVAPKLYDVTDGTWTDVTSNTATITRNGLFKTGNKTEYGGDEQAYYQLSDAEYCTEIKIEVSTSFTGRMLLGATSQCYALTYPEYVLLSTEQFNPYLQTLE